MILTPSDVGSLTSALSYWEYAEYASGALVAVACVGEYIASFKPWFTGGDRVRKERLEKRSTLLLIAALAAELICLVRTNQLSGQVIGALDAKSAEAYRKSRTALTNANDAIGKAKAASGEINAVRTEVGNVRIEAGKARSLAQNATRESSTARGASARAMQVAANSETVANTARKEADTFEADIVSAKKQAAEAESHLADALERANRAEGESTRLTARFADRTLTDAQVQAIAEALRSFSGQEYDLTTYWETPECVAISNRIYSALQAAQWRYTKSDAIGLFGGITGVQVFRHPDADDSTRLAVDTLIS